MAAEITDPERAGILRLSLVTTRDIPAAWVFIPISKINVEGLDLEIYIGQTYYENRSVNLQESVRIRSWVFCRESTPLPGVKAAPMIGVFHGGDHFCLGLDTTSGGGEFVRYLIDHIVPVLYPNIFDGKEDSFRAARALTFKRPNILDDISAAMAAQGKAVREVGQPRLLFGGGSNGSHKFDTRRLA
jgi:hypothetical protein